MIHDGILFVQPLYCARSNCVNLDSAKQGQIKALRSDRRSPSPKWEGLRRHEKVQWTFAVQSRGSALGRELARVDLAKLQPVQIYGIWPGAVWMQRRALVISLASSGSSSDAPRAVLIAFCAWIGL